MLNQIPSLDPGTHAYSFWEGVPYSGKKAFGRLFRTSRSMKVSRAGTVSILKYQTLGCSMHAVLCNAVGAHHDIEGCTSMYLHLNILQVCSAIRNGIGGKCNALLCGHNMWVL
jgi:hypothetical protein